MRLSAADESCHAVEDDPTFNESMYVNVLDAEALHEVKERYFRAMAAQIQRHGGKVSLKSPP